MVKREEEKKNLSLQNRTIFVKVESECLFKCFSLGFVFRKKNLQKQHRNRELIATGSLTDSIQFYMCVRCRSGNYGFLLCKGIFPKLRFFRLFFDRSIGISFYRIFQVVSNLLLISFENISHERSSKVMSSNFHIVKYKIFLSDLKNIQKLTEILKKPWKYNKSLNICYAIFNLSIFN